MLEINFRIYVHAQLLGNAGTEEADSENCFKHWCEKCVKVLYFVFRQPFSLDEKS